MGIFKNIFERRSAPAHMGLKTCRKKLADLKTCLTQGTWEDIVKTFKDLLVGPEGNKGRLQLRRRNVALQVVEDRDGVLTLLSVPESSRMV